jgi:hypothetical protein
MKNATRFQAAKNNHPVQNHQYTNSPVDNDDDGILLDT